MDPEARRLEDRVQVPKRLPGADIPRLEIPRRSDDEEAFNEAMRRLFPPLSDPPASPLESGGAPLPKVTLAELEQSALANSPIIPQFQSDVTMEAGQAIQAGTHPNPVIGYESDTVGSSLTRDYQGVYVNQLVKTAGKLELAQAIQNTELMNAQLALRQTQFDLRTQVRKLYFALLIARESLEINAAVERFTHELYLVRSTLFRRGEARLTRPTSSARWPWRRGAPWPRPGMISRRPGNN